MLHRTLADTLKEHLAQFPAVALLGPRQVGKTTLALEVAKAREQPFVYLDLESELDLAKLENVRSYLKCHQEKLVIIDEVHRRPGLFPELRGVIDESRREGKRAGMFLLLGAASLDLLHQSGETLAGRVSYLDLGPLSVSEIDSPAINTLWLRGGFPESFLAADDAQSMRWRTSFLRTYLERDLSQFAPRISPQAFRRLWIMLAHCQASMINMAELSRSMGIDQKTVASYIDLLLQLMLLRKLPAWSGNFGKRLVKTPKTYIGDSGVLHALLSIETTDDLLCHPIVGASWEGFVIENVLSVLHERAQGYFYRASGGAELDLLLEFRNGDRWAIEIKRSETPKLTRGFHAACKDILPKRKIVVTPGDGDWLIAPDIEVMSLGALARELSVRHGA